MFPEYFRNIFTYFEFHVEELSNSLRTIVDNGYNHRAFFNYLTIYNRFPR